MLHSTLRSGSGAPPGKRAFYGEAGHCCAAASDAHTTHVGLCTAVCTCCGWVWWLVRHGTRGIRIGRGVSCAQAAPSVDKAAAAAAREAHCADPARQWSRGSLHVGSKLFASHDWHWSPTCLGGEHVRLLLSLVSVANCTFTHLARVAGLIAGTFHTRPGDAEVDSKGRLPTAQITPGPMQHGPLPPCTTATYCCL
jgi:hypothetical protein